MPRPSFHHFGLIVSIALASFAAIPPTAEAAWLPNGVPLCTECEAQVAPVSIVSDGAQGAVVVWSDSRFGLPDISAQRVNGSGDVQWGANGIAVCSNAFGQYWPAAGFEPGGGAFISWVDRRTGSNDIYAQRINGQGLSQWTSDGIALGTTSLDEESQQVITDGASGFTARGWILAWASISTGPNGFPVWQLRVQHVDANAQALWTTPATGGVPLMSESGGSIQFAMVSDGVFFGGPHGAVVAWAQELAGGEYDIRAGRVSGAGVLQWPYGGIPICDLPGDQFDPAAAIVSGGNVVVAWTDLRGTDLDIWAQKLNASGSPQWLAQGLPICQAAGVQGEVRLVLDGAGGVIAVWQDQRSGTIKLYAQRFDGNGKPLWSPTDGIPLCTAPGLQFNHSVIFDGAGGAIVAWVDGRAGFDVYAQRVDANGNLLWSVEGTALSTAANTQFLPVLVGDSQSGAVAAWGDLRNGNRAVYATRITPATVDVPDPGPPAFRLAFVSSNPTRGEVRFRLELPQAATVTAEVMDARGRRVRSLHASSEFGAGTHLLTWDGADESGAPAPAGVYFACVRARGEMLTTRVVRLR